MPGACVEPEYWYFLLTHGPKGQGYDLPGICCLKALSEYVFLPLSLPPSMKA